MSGYMRADRICDLVMKGGITSGVVYPPAIDEIAQRFWLCGIGGTSAGAIAAALAAAAELRRRNGSAAGYEELRGLPGEISGDGRLLSLFKPDGSTRRAFGVLMRASRLKQQSGWFSRLRFYLDAAWLILTQRPLKRVVDNGLGLCTGMALNNRSTQDLLPPLTEWLSKRIDSIAGKPDGSPLTFADLWQAPYPPGLAETMAGVKPIQLQLNSTCLTFGRPYALPYLDNRFAFSPQELGRLFPGYVIDHMVAAGRRIAADLKLPLADGLLPFPNGGELPVIVAVRMSLSFPVLFSTVPLYYRNFHAQEHPVERVHFADGGITSNLPVYFFDSPFPRWPTLALNLQYASKRGQYGRSNVGPDKVWMSRDSRDGTLEMFNDFLGSATSLGKLLGLAGAIFRSAQVWTDNSFLVLPGYRDRVAELWLEPDEGGFNLEMPKATIDGLVERGRTAGRRLVERFADAPSTDPMSWDGHRWTRYRTAMASLAYYLRSWRRGVEHPMPGDRPLWSMLESVEAIPTYRIRSDDGETADQRRQAMEQATRDLMRYIDSLDAYPVFRDSANVRPFGNGPRPHVQLQTRAPLVPLAP